MLEHPIHCSDPSARTEVADGVTERVRALRAELAARSDSPVSLLGRLCELAGADNGVWFGNVRLVEDCRVDLASGWRPGALLVLWPASGLQDAILEPIPEREPGSAHDVMARLAARAGRFRAGRLRDLEPADWFLGGDYQQSYRAHGYGDALYVVSPVNRDAESCFGLFRSSGRSGFSEAERDLVAQALGGLEGVHRHLLLGHGLAIADAPLTPVEREVVQGMLVGLSESAVAQRCACSVEAVRACIPAACRKFGVDGRAGLMALWLGRVP